MTVIGSSRALHELPVPDSTDRLRLGWAALTDVGRRRPHNEDSLLASPPLFVVADGMGGHSAGDFASAAVVTRLAERITGPFISAGDVEEALRIAEADIALVSRHSLLGTGTTVTGVALTLVGGQPQFLVFNIGDSRVYSWRGNRLEQVTVDHSVVQSMVDAGTITRDQAERHPDSNMITRAIGFADPPIPDYWLIPATAGLRLVVCSDGLNGELLDHDLRDHVGSGADAASTARTLVDAALEHGGRDNVSVIVVDVFGSANEGTA
ncbi:PP2C family protein-serine/threonine phosphatase [Planctomonas psychrotolerans]|uniref:PP2C family protein-serine/threonine phosphatase n=1 Tax=Planctomonas psychrotolerans TaxID=2528712 RepID=UPI00123B9B95|nr:protein phosphatase 2C domain-containing protein [Planctomonas psychrotolerans]